MVVHVGKNQDQVRDMEEPVASTKIKFASRQSTKTRPKAMVTRSMASLMRESRRPLQTHRCRQWLRGKSMTGADTTHTGVGVASALKLRGARTRT